jgi:hypothetical protein
MKTPHSRRISISAASAKFFSRGSALRKAIRVSPRSPRDLWNGEVATDERRRLHASSPHVHESRSGRENLSAIFEKHLVGPLASGGNRRKAPTRQNRLMSAHRSWTKPLGSKLNGTDFGPLLADSRHALACCKAFELFQANDLSGPCGSPEDRGLGAFPAAKNIQLAKAVNLHVDINANDIQLL